MPRNFRVIIIGGGLAGLTLAHALHLAGIDYVLYDKRPSLVESLGAAFALQPQNVRLLKQFGLLEQALPLAPLMKAHRAVAPDGKVLGEFEFFQCIYKNHGYPFLLFERWEFLRLLYETLPDRGACVRAGRSVESIEVLDDGVRVGFDNGTIEEGSIVVGADGVYSRVRELMDNLAGECQQRYMSSFQALYGIGPQLEGMEPGIVTEISHSGFWFQIIAQPERVFWNLYKALDQPTYGRVRYSEEEIESLVNDFRDYSVNDGYVLGDLWKSRWRAKLAPLEEGIMKHWHWKRIVLVGDAAHKVTPNQAHSGNMAMEAAASLANHLYSLHSENTEPEIKTLGETFREYQQQQEPLARNYWKSTNFQLRSMARLTPWLRFQTSCILPLYSPRWIVDHKLAYLMSDAAKLDYVELPDSQRGWVRYAEEMKGLTSLERARIWWRRLWCRIIGALLPF